jgi:hypothetical protein
MKQKNSKNAISKNNNIVKAKDLKHKIRKKQFIEALKTSLGVITQAEKISGIHREEHYKWIKEDENYLKQYNEIRNITDDFVESKLYQLVNELNPTAIIFYCKTRMKNRGYDERAEIQINTINKIDLSALNTDELKLYIELQKKIENSKIEEADYEEENEREE